jgi:hypothetical protein
MPHTAYKPSIRGTNVNKEPTHTRPTLPKILSTHQPLSQSQASGLDNAAKFGNEVSNFFIREVPSRASKAVAEGLNRVAKGVNRATNLVSGTRSKDAIPAGGGKRKRNSTKNPKTPKNDSKTPKRKNPKSKKPCKK